MNGQDDFLRLARKMFSLVRIFCLNGFDVPSKRGKGKKIRVTVRSVFKLIFNLLFMVSLLALNLVVYARHRKMTESTASSPVSPLNLLVVRLMSIIGLSMIITNVFMDIMNRSRIWFIVCALCDFDICGKACSQWKISLIQIHEVPLIPFFYIYQLDRCEKSEAKSKIVKRNC